MSDKLGLFEPNEDTGNVDLNELRAVLARTATEPPPARDEVPTPRREARAKREAQQRRTKRRRRHTLVAVLVLALLAAGISVGIFLWRSHANEVPNFSGASGEQTFVRVKGGDSTIDIANTLASAKVIASAQSFIDATGSDADIKALKPGYFRLSTHLSAADAAAELVDDGNRVGQLRLIPGRQLADVSTQSGGGGTVTSGYVSDIAKAACIPLNGSSDCWSAEDLWEQVETAGTTDLRIPAWAVDGVNSAPDPKKRLEGLILPGDYDIPPDSTPLQALQAVMSASTAQWETSDLVGGSKRAGLTPYQSVIIASLVEREGITSDMPKVARVIENRLQVQGMLLQLDSTVNYALDRAQISTTSTDRQNPSPYNTYAHSGLPPTPISSPSQDAVDATLTPATGAWMYFVKVELDGTSCFSVTLDEHDACVDKARANGVFG